MTAADILDRLLDELGETLDLAINEPGAEPSPLLDMLEAKVLEAKGERDRARLIFGEAA